MFEYDLKEIFHKDIIENYNHNSKERKLTFDIRSRYGRVDITFEKLAELSKLLRTRKINLGEVSQEESGCPTCGATTQTIQSIYAYDIKYEWEEENGQ